MKELIKTIAQALVDQPDCVIVTETNGTHTSIIKLQVSQSDIGKVIGKHGRTAVAMRTILSAASGMLKKRIVLEILDDIKTSKKD